MRTLGAIIATGLLSIVVGALVALAMLWLGGLL